MGQTTLFRLIVAFSICTSLGCASKSETQTATQRAELESTFVLLDTQPGNPVLAPRAAIVFTVDSTLGSGSGTGSGSASGQGSGSSALNPALKQVDFYSGTAFLKRVTSAPFSLAYSDIPPGVHKLTAYGIDQSLRHGSVSKTITVTKPANADQTPPSPPTLSVSSTSCAQVNLLWTPSTDAGASGLFGYNVYVNDRFVKFMLAPASQLSYAPLDGSASLSYSVSAIDRAYNESTRTPIARAACASGSTFPLYSVRSAPPSVIAPTQVVFEVSSTDPNAGEIGAVTGPLLNRVDFYNGTAFLKSVTQAPYTLMILNTVPGSMQLRAEAVDIYGRKAIVTNFFSVVKPNPTAFPTDTTAPTAPTLSIASASCLQTRLAWTASTDSGGAGLRGFAVYVNNWFVGFVAPQLLDTTYPLRDSNASFAYSVAAVDRSFNASTRTAVNHVACANLPPIANAGADRSATNVENLSFDGSASSDPDGMIVDYAWNFGDSTSANGLSVSHTFATAGTYTVSLTVRDSSGATASDSATVVVSTAQGACTTNAQCGSGFCVDGVCCNTACAGACDACNLPGLNGTCSPMAAGTICRASSGVCDAAETCSGSSAMCPADGKAPAGTLCRASAGPCDIQETCNGSANTCPADGFASVATQCRASAGACDVAESCTGTSASCPNDAKAPIVTVCRSSAGPCDAQETCNGIAVTCPADGFLSAATVCRASAGACDAQETCSGAAAACPTDAKLPASTVCRASAGPCDVAETCTGSANTCPASDAKSPAGTICRASAGDCDVAETCNGSAVTCPNEAFAPASTVCRAAVGPCDIAETCTGTAAVCPANVTKPAGGTCDDGNLCTHTDQCNASGVCAGTAVTCAGTFACALSSCNGTATCTVTNAPATTTCDAFTGAKCTGSSQTCPTTTYEAGETLFSSTTCY